MKIKNILRYSSLLLLLTLFFQPTNAQRFIENLDRGVVAVRNTSGGFFVSWRYFATDREDVRFNLYAKKAIAGSFTKLNDAPLVQTNFTAAAGSIGTGTQLYVCPVINDTEGEPSGTFTVSAHGFTPYRSAYLDIAFNPANDGLELTAYNTKFIWPADLDGDGEYDFVVDRLSTTGQSHKIQAYLRDGTLLWTVDMGPNVKICEGQDDMVIAYDMDQDGKAEVVVKSSDGTQFADGKGVFGSVSLDTDNDGIINYFTQNVKNSPQYITVIDGLTGKEKNSIEMDYPSVYNRNNKADFMGEEYNNLNGHMAIIYPDGKKPAVGFIYKVRSTNGTHYYFASAWSYNDAGQWSNLFNWERGGLDAAEAHSIRAADVDRDGKDELLNIGFGLRGDGSLAFNAHISHGDRFRVGDIDPERPGLETFAIQQNAPSLLGMLIYDAGTGEHLKKFHLPAVGDVGRGECMDVDPNRLGYEFWSTMPNMYDAKGNVIHEGSAPWPYEGVWWDGEPDREQLSSSDGNGFNADIRKFDLSSRSFGNRLIEFAKMTNWQLNSSYGVRPAFFGDIAGDWREEVVLKKRSSVVVDGKTLESVNGIVGFSTDYPTNHRLYCLMQNPAYRMQATTRGYYQSPFPDFYLGYDMPAPPVAPVQQARLTWKAGSTLDKSTSAFVLRDKSQAAFSDGEDIMFDISGNNSGVIALNDQLSPSVVWAMNPLGHDYVIAGNGAFTGTMELVKSMAGTFTLNGDHTYSGLTRISEGTLCVNGSLAGPVRVDAHGTLSGNVLLADTLVLQPGLHTEGSRLAPGNGLASGKLGKITLSRSLVLNGKSTLHFDILPDDNYKNDSLVINGDLRLSGINTLVINTATESLAPGRYSLISWTGKLEGDLTTLSLQGTSGIPAVLELEGNTLQLVVSETRSAGSVVWTGQESAVWDFTSDNFSIAGSPTTFVSGDEVAFNDQAVQKTITLTDQFKIAKAVFNNQSAYVLKGSGGIAGDGDLEKSGVGLLDLQTVNNSYTGKTLLNNARVQVASLSDAGATGSLGASAGIARSIQLNNSALIVNAVGTGTNRGILLTGNDTISVPKSNGVLSLGGVMEGDGTLVLTGNGQINLSAPSPNIHKGGTIIDKARVALGSVLMNNNGVGTGPLQFVNGGRLTMFYSTAYGQTSVWNMVVPANQSGTLVASGRCSIEGTLTGEGTLNVVTPYVRADWTANSQNFAGRLNVTSDNDGGTFRITRNTGGFPNATISIGDKVEMGAYSSTGASGTNNSTTVKIGALEGSAAASVAGGKWEIGYTNNDAVYNGSFTATATVTKVGTGKWTLTGNSSSTSVVNINGGTLEVNNTSGSATGTSAVYVKEGATLTGKGIIGGSTLVYSGALLSPGTGTFGLGTLTINGILSLLSGSVTEIDLLGANYDKLVVGGTASLNGTLKLTNKGVPYTAGSSYKIIEAKTITGSFSTIVPELPGEGLRWNTSRMAEGIISIDTASGLDDTESLLVELFPQPADDYCFIRFNNQLQAQQMELIDSNGKTLRLITDLDFSDYKLETGGLPAGIYYLKITGSDQQTIVRKMIKK